MGQSIGSMGQQQSKDELLYQLVSTGNVEAITTLCREGASLEWIDEKGRTPLIVACMNPGLIDVAKTLIEMGANVNAYRPGGHAGTPLHHAAKRGLEPTVKLLLSHGANALVRNDDCQTPLDVARIKGYTSVVRAIENHICYFSGWLLEFYGPGFLEALAPQLLSRKIWVVVIPCGSTNTMNPLRFELAIYPRLQDAQPRTVIALWKARIEEPNFHHSDLVLIIVDQSKTRYKLSPAIAGDKQQLQWLYNVCRGIPQIMAPPAFHDSQTSVPETEHQTAAEAVELAMVISASIHSATEDTPPLVRNSHQRPEAINANGWGNSVDVDSHNGWGPAIGPVNSEASSSGGMDEPAKDKYNGWGVPDSGSVGNQRQRVQTHGNPPPNVQTSCEITASVSSAPSAPPIPEEVLGEGPIHYPLIDHSPGDLTVPAIEYGAPVTNEMKDEGGSTLCVICWEAPIEGACIPCGHMAGCMSCLNEIKARKGVCPICRAKINEVIRLFAV